MQEEAVKLFTSSQRWDLLNALLHPQVDCYEAQLGRVVATRRCLQERSVG